jgi:S1-C subfamily serine protease
VEGEGFTRRLGMKNHEEAGRPKALVGLLVCCAVCAVLGLAAGGGIGYTIGHRAGSSLSATPTELADQDVPVEQTAYPYAPIGPLKIYPPLRSGVACLGVTYETTDQGAKVQSVDADSPAAVGGLQVGDVVTAVDGEPVGSGHPDLSARIAANDPCTQVELGLQRRAGEPATLSLVLGHCGYARTVAADFDAPRELHTMTFGPLSVTTAWLGLYLSSGDAMVIREVAPGGPAADAGLRPGDRILAVDGIIVTTSSGFMRLISAYEPGDQVTLSVERDNEEMDVTAQFGRWDQTAPRFRVTFTPDCKPCSATEDGQLPSD